jgi:hypothetical protein
MCWGCGGGKALRVWPWLDGGRGPMEIELSDANNKIETLWASSAMLWPPLRREGAEGLAVADVGMWGPLERPVVAVPHNKCLMAMKSVS